MAWLNVAQWFHSRSGCEPTPGLVFYQSAPLAPRRGRQVTLAPSPVSTGGYGRVRVFNCTSLLFLVRFFLLAPQPEPSAWIWIGLERQRLRRTAAQSPMLWNSKIWRDWRILLARTHPELRAGGASRVASNAARNLREHFSKSLVWNKNALWSEDRWAAASE